MRVIQFAFIAVLLSATCAQAQQHVPVRRKVNRSAILQKKLKLASLIHPDGTPPPPPTPASLVNPAGLAFDPSGNLYIAAPARLEILKMTPQGQLSVFAGNGNAGLTGDGGPATDATLEDPFGVTVDASGNVFIADTVNNVIREVTTDGIINTVAGGGIVCGSATDAFGDGCPALQATLNQPEAVAIDVNGNLLIADTNDALVRRVSKTTGVISVVAGGASSLCPGALNNIGDGCPATSALLDAPLSVTADASGNIFISDAGFPVVRVVNSQGVISVYAGNYGFGFTANGVAATSTTLDQPENVAVDASGNLYVADNTTNEVREVNAGTKTISDAAGNVFGPDAYGGDGGPATQATFFSVWGVAVSPTNGNLYISDFLNSQVRVVNRTTGVISTFVAPDVTSPQAIVQFDKQIVNTISTQTVNLTNTSGATLTISEILIQGPYTETDNCVAVPLSPGQSCQVFVTFAPTLVCETDAQGNGVNDGAIEYFHNGPGGANVLSFNGNGASAGGLSVTDLTDVITASSVAQSLVGSGVSISNVTYTGAPEAAGIFSGGANIVGFSSGALLTAGSLANTVGPNCQTGIQRDNGLPGDTDLQSLLPAGSAATMDAAALEFDFVPVGNVLNFKYVFASDEYNEEVGFFNDVFGFFVNGANAALVPGTNTPVSVNTVNNGNSDDPDIPATNPAFFVNNDLQFPNAAPLNTEMDGLTQVLSVNVAVNPGVTNHIKLAIADTGDHIFDSAVFIASGSLNSSPLELSVGTLAFGNEAVNAVSPPQIVSLTNSGAGTVNIASITASTGYTRTTTCGASLASAQSCNVSVSFAPTGTGLVEGTLTVTSDADGPNTVQTVTLSGTGVSPLTISLPSSITFPAQAINTTGQPMAVTMTNNPTSAANAVIASASTSGPFAISPGGTCFFGGAGITADNSCTILVSFTPTGTAPSSGTLTILDNATGNPHSVALSGTTSAAQITVQVSPPSLTFPQQALNTTSSAMTVTVLNNSPSATNVTFSNISTTGPFAVASGGTCSTTGAGIAQNASCTIHVTFTPTGTAPSAGTLSITDNAAGSPQSVTLNGTTTPPAIIVQVAPPSLTFPAQLLNTTSAAMTVTITNNSATATNVTFSSISTTGPFAVASGGTCSTVGAGIAQNASCTIKITFTPTGTAASSGTLLIADNATGSPQSVTLNGTTAAQVTTVMVAPATVTFPAQAQNTTSAPMTVTVKNVSTGSETVTFSAISASGPFAVSGGTCVVDGTPLAPNASCTIAVTFTPTGTAASSGTLSIADDASGSPQTVTLNGTTLGPPTVTVTPPSLTFPATVQNTTSAPLTVTVKNTSTGGQTISFSSISTTGPFAISGGTCSTDASPLAVNASCTISVTFTPTGAAASSGTLSIADNATGSPQNVPLSGTTLVPQISVQITPASVTFPATLQNTSSAPQTVTVKNTSTGGGTVSFSNISTGEGPFAVSGGTCSTDSAPLAANASCTITVTFTPTGTAASSGALTIADNALNSPQSVPLNGTTLVPQTLVSVTPPSLTFPATTQGTTSAPMTVTVMNTSTNEATVSFSNISASEPFAVSGGTCQADSDTGVSVGSSCTITVTFTPTGTEPSSGSLTITDNAVDSPQSVPLSGTTLIPQTFTLTVGGNGDGSATVNPGDTAVFPIVLTGTEGTTGTVNLTCTPSTPTITCTVTPTSITLNGTTSVNTGISVVTFCSWAPPVGGPSGRWGGPRRFIIPVGSLIGLLLMLVLFARAQRRRWVPAMAAVLLLAVGVAGCKSLAKGPEGKTLPGTYTLTLTGTLDGQSQSLPLTLIVK